MVRSFSAVLCTSILLMGLIGCGAGDGQLSVNSNSTSSNASASLAWDVPTTYSDGSELVPAGYKIYYGTSSGNYTQVIDTGNTTVYSLSDLNLAPGTYYFTVTVYDSTGMESDLSNEVSKTVV
ncbi:MAG TPA: fibronectin type III domain-containing protein [Nitrospirota bacterium]